MCLFLDSNLSVLEYHVVMVNDAAVLQVIWEV